MKQILKKIKKLYATKPWNRNSREVTNLIRFISGMCTNYAKYLDCTPGEVLEAIEERRNYAAPNYYQRSNFPKLKNIDIYESKEEYKKKHSGQFICCSCKKEISDSQHCPLCDWKSYGLFGTFGEGHTFIIKEDFLERPIVYKTFKPIELYKE